MTKQKWIATAMGSIAVLWVGLIVAAKWIQHDLNRDLSDAVQPDPMQKQPYWDVPTFSFSDQDGRQVTNRDLLGHVWIADFFFTQCTTACPVLTSKLMLLQKQLKLPGIRFISFSVDPEHDTPEALKKYAQLWEGDESRWRLLSTDPTGLTRVAKGMNVAVAPTRDKDNPIMHSTLFMLVDASGKVRGIYDSIDNQAMLQLAEAAKYYAGGGDQPAMNTIATGLTSIERGHVLFGSMGCVACHSQPRIAPPLQSLYGSQVRLDNHKTVWADEAYLHESIVDPNAKIVAGYGRTMPTYHSYLDDGQIMDLVAYIESISTNKPGGHGVVANASTQPDTVELLIDPVCKMQVTSDPSAPHANFNGKTYFFCSEHCKEQFLKSPANYTLTKNMDH